METIFTVTVIRKKGKRDSQRTWGWFSSLEEAKKSIEASMNHYFEDGYYNYLVIEEYRPGSLAMSENEWWYMCRLTLNTGREEVFEIEKPEEFKNTVHFAMG